MDDEWQFIRKHDFEYPNYDAKLTDKELEKYHEYNFKKPRVSSESRDSSPHKAKDLQSFLKTLFSNNEEIKEVVMLMKDLLDLSIDHRMLYIIREKLIKNCKEHNDTTVSVDDFRKEWRSLMDQEKHEQHPHMELKVLHTITDETGQVINMKKLANIVDVSEFYPLIVKKNKNFSEELYYVLSSGTTKDHTQGLEQHISRKTKTIDELKSEQICEFVWSKVEEKFDKLADAFRFFDIDNNTQLTKKEFRDGLERLKIKLSPADIELVFNYLDKNKNGWLSYREF